MARPRKFTDDAIAAALRKTHGLVYLAAKLAGCSPDTVHRRAKSSAAVAAAIAEERATLLDTAEQKLAEAVDRGEAWAITFTLKTLGKDRGYVERREAVHSGTLQLVEEIVDAPPDAGPGHLRAV